MGATDIRAGRAYVELNVQDKLSRGLARAAAKLKAFGASINTMGIRMMAAGAAVMTPLLGAAKLFADTGHDLVEMSARTGISVEALSELGYAAEQSGVSMEALGIAVKMMQKSITAAAGGTKSTIKTLAQLGLTAKDLVGLAPEKQFELLANQLSLIEDPTVKAATALKLFGRSGTAMLPLLKDGAAGIEALRQRARDLGFVISTEDAEAGAEFHDVLLDMWRGIKMAAFVIGGALAPALKDAAVWIMVHVKRVADWIKKNQGLVVSLLKASAYTMAAGAALIVLGKAIQGVGVALKLLSIGTSVVGAVLSTLVSTIAWMLTPLGAVVGAVAALGAAFLYFSGYGGKLLGWLGDRFGDLKSDALKSFQGISDALAAGDIGLAAQILWLTLKMWWYQGVSWLLAIWQPAEKFFLESWYGLLGAWEVVQHGLAVAFIETTAALKSAWLSFSVFARQTWETTTDWIAKRLLEIQGLFDETLDVAGAKAMIDAQATVTTGRIESEASAQKAEIENIRAGSRTAESGRHEKEMTALGDKWNVIEADQARQKAQNQKDLDQVREAWRVAIQEAARERAAAEKPGMPGKPRMPSFDLGQMAAELSKNLGARGTFNAAAIQGLMGGDALERTADAAEETAENTARMRERLDEMEGAEFAE